MIANYSGSLRYDMNGRKRKKQKTIDSKKKDTPTVSSSREYSVVPAYSRHDPVIERQRYPSAAITSVHVPAQDTSYKREVSAQYTIAPAYNKGAYQVISRNDIEHIGK